MKRLILGLLILGLFVTRLATAASAGAAPALTVSPGSGPRGSVTTVTAGNLAASTKHLVQLVSGTGNTNTTRLFEATVPSDARGALTYRLTVDQNAGAYTVRIVAIGGTDRVSRRPSAGSRSPARGAPV